MWSDNHPQGSGENPGPYFSPLKWGEKMKTSRDKVFWHVVGYIRKYHGLYEMAFGTKGLFRAARELTKHFEYAEEKKGLEWVLGNFDEHIDEYIMEQEEMANATQNYVFAVEENEFLRDQFA